MKKFLVVVLFLLLAALIITTTIKISKQEEKIDETVELAFEDVAQDAWYYDYVAHASDAGWIHGTSFHTFSPEELITRGQFALLLYRYLGSPDAGGIHNPYLDLDDSNQGQAIIYLTDVEVLTGVDETHFAPSQAISREEMAVMLYRMGGKKVDAELSPSGKFIDYARISPWALDAMDWAVEYRILEGVGGGMLAPKASATRAQAVKLLCRYQDVRGEGVKPPEAGEAVVLRVWQAGVDNSNAAKSMQKLLNRFETRNDGMTVEYTPIPWVDDPYEKIANALEEGTAPDILIVSAPYEAMLADKGQLLPLDTLLTQAALEDVNAGLLMECRYQRTANPELKGRIISVPVYASPRAILFNLDIFDHFGEAYPSENFTYKALCEKAAAVTGAREGRKLYGFGTSAGSPLLHLSMIWEAGGSIVDPKSGLAATDSDIWLQESARFLQLYTENLTPDYSVTLDYYSQLSMFANGSIAMIDASLNAAQIIQSRDGWGDKLGVYPYLDQTAASALTLGEVAVINAATEHVVDAARLLNYLLEPETQLFYARDIGALPAVASAIPDSELETDAFLAPYISGMKDTQALGSKDHQVYELLLKHLQRLLRREVSVEVYSKELTDELNAVLQAE